MTIRIPDLIELTLFETHRYHSMKKITYFIMLKLRKLSFDIHWEHY